MASIHLQFCLKHISPCFTTLYNQMLSLAIGLNLHTFHSRQLQQPLTFCTLYSLVDQLYAKEVYFCSFVIKFNQAFTKYSPDVFNSFYRTVTHGRTSHWIFTRPCSCNASPRFTIEPLHSVASPFFFHYSHPNSLQKICEILIGPEKPPHSLFFRFKQNVRFHFAPFYPSRWNTAKRYMQFQ